MTVIRINGSSTGYQPQAADIAGDIGLSELSDYNLGGNLSGLNSHGVDAVTFLSLDNAHSSDRDVKLSVNPASHHQMILTGTNANFGAQRKTEIGFKQADSSSEIFQGIFGFRHKSNGADEFRISHLSDDGDTTKDILTHSQNSSTDLFNGHGVALFNLLQSKAICTKRLDVTGVQTEPHTLFVNTDMSASLSDDLHNSMTCFLDFTGSTINGTRQNSITFSIEDDGGAKTVGKFNAEYNSSGTNQNKMKLIAVDNTSSNPVNGQIDVSPLRGQVNVPWKLASYTTTERNALSVPNGSQIYNETTHKFQGYANGAWVDLN